MKSPSHVLFEAIRDVGREDPRRGVHAMKVGVYFTLVSFMYLWKSLYNDLGQSTILAVMAGALVLEYTAGATLLKILNLGLGVALAWSLAYFVEIISDECSVLGRAAFIGAALLCIGAVSTYIRFIPGVEKHCDDGVVIFLLTFSLIILSNLRVSDVVKIAEERILTIAIVGGICLLMTLFVFPKWSGEDLHNSTVEKLEGLSRSVEACVKRYFKEEVASENEDAIYDDYKDVLDLQSEEDLALHTSWEPRHLTRFRYPSRQYVKVGAALRQLGCSVAALHGHLQRDLQISDDCRALLRDPCIHTAAEVSRILLELAESVKNRRHLSPDILSGDIKKALVGLPSSGFVALLVEAAASLDKIVEEFRELAKVASFQEYQHVVDEVILEVDETGTELGPILPIEPREDDDRTTVQQLRFRGETKTVSQNFEHGESSRSAESKINSLAWNLIFELEKEMEKNYLLGLEMEFFKLLVSETYSHS